MSSSPSSDDKWRDLNLTRDEFTRITDAFKKEEFRKMFFDYCNEISDPENRKIYEQEIKQLEAQRGVDCKFVHPNPGFVVKCFAKSEKIFINVAQNELVERPQSRNDRNAQGQIGLTWSLPYIQAPARRDVDRKNARCTCYDVIFHPDTLRLAERNKGFREMVVNTAIDALKNAFGVEVDKNNLRFPKVTYKGMARPTVIRRKDVSLQEEEPGPLDHMMPPVPEDEPGKPRKAESSEKPARKYTKPEFRLKFRKDLEMAEFTQEIDAKIDSTMPKEIIVEVFLPQLKSAEDIELDVTPTMMLLRSEKPAKYELEVRFPYQVDDKAGGAKFDKDTRKLMVTLPVVRKNIITVKDIVEVKSGGALIEEIDSPEEKTEPKVEFYPEPEVNSIEESKGFLDSDKDYRLPEFRFKSVSTESSTLILDVKSVDPESFEAEKLDDHLKVKFTSVGEGYFPVFYACCLQLEDDQFNPIEIDTWTFEALEEFALVTLDHKNDLEPKICSFGLTSGSLVDLKVEEKLVNCEEMVKYQLKVPKKVEIVIRPEEVAEIQFESQTISSLRA